MRVLNINLVIEFKTFQKVLSMCKKNRAFVSRNMYMYFGMEYICIHPESVEMQFKSSKQNTHWASYILKFNTTIFTFFIKKGYYKYTLTKGAQLFQRLDWLWRSLTKLQENCEYMFVQWMEFYRILWQVCVNVAFPTQLWVSDGYHL